MILRAPFPWFGGKSRVADVVWRAFGDVPNYVEPFFGSGAVLLARPHAPRVETVNDSDCYLTNFWRATRAAPDEVASWAEGPIHEADMHARQAWLATLPGFREQMMTDPDFFNAKAAGWWLWGVCAWLRGGWCGHGVGRRQIPLIGSPGNGVHSPSQRDGTRALLAQIADRLRHVRVCCGDWKRVVGTATLGADKRGFNRGMSPCAVLLDPPYDDGAIFYADGGAGLSADVRVWALAHGNNPKLRIALCGYDGEHNMPDEWRCVAWKSKGGSTNADRERVWLSPHCLSDVGQIGLWGGP